MTMHASDPKDSKPARLVDVSKEKLKRSRGIYLLPNLFTTASLFAGFYAIVAAMKGNFEISSIAIFIAIFKFYHRRITKSS